MRCVGRRCKSKATMYARVDNVLAPLCDEHASASVRAGYIDSVEDLSFLADNPARVFERKTKNTSA